MIEHDSQQQRFTLQHEGHSASLHYTLAGKQMHIISTQVPGAIAGRGLASRLNQHALMHARNAGLTVVPECSYTQSYIRRHPEFQDLLAI